MYLLKSIARYYIPLIAVMTVLQAAIYLGLQQEYRHLANDPQIQVAEDTAAAVGSGQGPDLTVMSNHINIANSLALYLVFYDETGRPISGTGFLNGTLPQLPPGVFDSARQNTQNRITWQPEPGTRSAIVLVHYAGERSGFVLAGRSLREEENRIDQLGQIMTVIWVVGAIGLLILVGLCQLFFSGNNAS